MKLIGAGAIFSAFICAGVLRVYDKKRHIQFLTEMIEALRLLSAELQDRRPPMKELLEWTAAHTAGESAVFFNKLADDLSRLGEESFEQLWLAAMENYLDSAKTTDYHDLCSLGKMLGRTDLSKQISALESCCHMLHARLERERSCFREDKKLCLGVSAALGLLVCILLL